MLKSAPEYAATDQKDSYLVITRDASLFDPFSPTALFLSDIASSVAELHILFIGKGKIKDKSKKINDNTYLYIVRPFPIFPLFSIFATIKKELVWKEKFQPKVILSIGDEISIASKVAKKYRCPLYVFYSYMKALGKESISARVLLKAAPNTVFVPNEYIKKSIEQDHRYNPNIKVNIITEYIDIGKLKNIFEVKDMDEAIKTRNHIFTMLVFPRDVSLKTFRMIKNIGLAIKGDILKFRFIVVVKNSQIKFAKFLKKILRLSIELSREDSDSSALFYQSRIMLYFEERYASYEPVLYSLMAGCPVLSSGDEYSKQVMFGSGLEEFVNIKRDHASFGNAIRKFVNDPYLYGQYKMNCTGFVDKSFNSDHKAYLESLQSALHP